MGILGESFRYMTEGISELEAALDGRDPRELRCPKCDVRHIKRVSEDRVECPECGVIEPYELN